jgi:hypothetical protein
MPQTAQDIEYRAAPYGGIATIPAGTPVTPANNLPDTGQYWVEEWEGMTEEELSWHRNYGFLVQENEVVQS